LNDAAPGLWITSIFKKALKKAEEHSPDREKTHDSIHFKNPLTRRTHIEADTKDGIHAMESSLQTYRHLENRLG
jgi:hypothetical protein